jgi:hypothetical protein
LGWVRQGADAAGRLAEQLQGIIERHGEMARPPATGAVVLTRVEDKPSQGIDDKSLEALIDRLLKERGL